MVPIGRQWASGLSLLLSAFRFFSTSAPQGVRGSPPLMLAPTSRNVASGGPSGGVGEAAAGGWPPGVAGGAPPPPRHRPERSGLPSAVLGAGAVRFGSPFGSRGTPGEGYDFHCANSDGDAVATIAI